MEYIIPVIGFLAALVAVRGSTWIESKPGLRAVTRTGWITIFLAVAALGTSLALSASERREARADEFRSTSTLANTKAAKDTIRLLREQLADARAEIDSANHKLDSVSIRLAAYEQVLKAIRTQSDRQPQQVMDQFVNLQNGEWQAPNSIYAGSVVKLYGFDCEISLRYANREERISARPYPPPEVMLIGVPGVPMGWTLRADRPCSGKVQVMSTPRGRSINWSWVEEQIPTNDSP